MTEEELYNEYRSSNCKSFTDFLINKIAELKEKYNRLNELKDFTFETYKGYGEIYVKELVRLFESRGYRLDGAYQENIKLQGQITKATEIIRDFISVAIDYIDKEDKNYSYIVEAQQFLNIEVEK